MIRSGTIVASNIKIVIFIVICGHHLAGGAVDVC